MIAGISYRASQAGQRTVYAARNLRDLALIRRSRTSRDVSAVVVGRNDDYMPNFPERLRATIAWNLRHGISEVVFVEWNPPGQNELLSPGVAEEFDSASCYVVSPVVHQRLCRNPNLALLEYHAKNVGVRRARGEWILATNADVALGPDTVRSLRRGLVAPDVAWTAQRVDIRWPAGRVRRVGGRDCLGYKRVNPYQRYGTGDFLLAHRSVWHRIRGYDESLVSHRYLCDVRGTGQMLEHGTELRRAGNVLHLEHATSCTEGVRPHHGEHAGLDDLPYQNPNEWGLGGYEEVPIAERVWRIG